ncbi:hypothetical protein LOTGIDRAFT_164905 [Lottia gigantea]|uniref:Pacifastin domain-containing protein n=1 Tax=Lottia gigantea TaxID=225164 RepID=V4A8I3_LOTGI|nr:hypothetical protein LOTGIDRAFT_164905 [Lottia gigantea]ESO89606.1 hypothetical protein LOTGIDRAFT_164905 [Lottia gigantea]
MMTKMLTIIFSVLIVLCSSSPECGPNYFEGDKWFDGCNWCTCTDNKEKCTNATCTEYQDELDNSPCQKLGESWRDGCYHCRCLPDGIRCRANKRCVHALKSDDLNCPVDGLCVCGLDGVPSCNEQIMSRFSFKNVPELGPDTSSDKKLILSSKGENTLRLNPDEAETDLGDKDLHLIPTDDKLCHLGPRWYGGGLRCYCDPQNGVACGNPRFIARKVDGFKIRSKKCRVGKIWEERCRICTCKKSGLSLCRIDRECTKNKNIRHSVKSIVVAGNAECRVGLRWKDGCKRCRCNKRGKIICKTRLCNLSDDGKKLSNKDKTHRQTSTGGLISKSTPRFQLPEKPRFRMPNLSLYNNRFQRKKRPSIKTVNCNGFKPGEKYWDKCNLCHCTMAGAPMCSSKLC